MNIDIKTADGEEVELGGTYYDEKGARYQDSRPSISRYIESLLH